MNQELAHKLNSNILKITLSEVFFSFGLISAIYILFFQFIGFSFNDIGLFEAITSIAIILIDLPTGALADFIGRKWTIIIANIFMLAMALLLGFSSGGMLILILAGLLNGLEFSFKSGAKTALIYDTLKELKKEDKFLKISGKINAYARISGIVGMILGAFLFSINPRLPYWTWSIFILLSIITLLSVQEPMKFNRKYNLREHYLDMKHTIKYIFNNKKLLWISIFFLIPAVFAESYWDVFSQAHLELLNLNPAYLGVVFSIFAGFNALISYYADDIEKKIGEKRSLYLIIIIEALLFFAMAYINILIALIIAIIVFTMNREYLELVSDNYQNKHIPSKNRASILSGISFLNNSLFGGAILIWLFGLSIDTLGNFQTLIISGSIVLIFGLILLQIRYSKKYYKILK